MRTVLLFSLVLASGVYLVGQGQPTPAKPTPTQPTPAKPTPAPAPAPAPAQPAPTQPGQTPPKAAAPRRTPPASTRSGMAITVTDNRGLTLPGVRVEILGSSDRSGETNASGQISFPGLQAGTYRLRFSGETVVAFEREVVLRGGQIADVDVMLNLAPRKEPAPAPAPVPVPAPVTASVGPIGQPQSQNVADLLEKEFIRREPRRESLISCSGNTRSTMVQLNDPMPERLYENADAVYYVLAGEGTLRVNGQESRVATNGVLSVPRGASHSFARRGNRPLVLLAVLSGEPCDTAK